MNSLPMGRSNKKAPKIKIEFSDSAGAKYSFAVEGGMSKDNMARLMEFVESMSSEPQHQGQEDYSNIDTNFSRVYGLLMTKFKFGSFTSTDVLEAYQDEVGVDVSLSTISTYLSRLAERGLVTRTRNGSGWIYKLVRVEQKDVEQPATMIAEQEERNSLLTP